MADSIISTPCCKNSKNLKLALCRVSNLCARFADSVDRLEASVEDYPEAKRQLYENSHVIRLLSLSEEFAIMIKDLFSKDGGSKNE